MGGKLPERIRAAFPSAAIQAAVPIANRGLVETHRPCRLPVMARLVRIGANLSGWRHGRCSTIMPGASPTSTPGGVETAERRGWWAPRPSPGTCFAHHDEGAGTDLAWARQIQAVVADQAGVSG